MDTRSCAKPCMPLVDVMTLYKHETETRPRYSLNPKTQTWYQSILFPDLAAATTLQLHHPIPNNQSSRRCSRFHQNPTQPNPETLDRSDHNVRLKFNQLDISPSRRLGGSSYAAADPIKLPTREGTRDSCLPWWQCHGTTRWY
jgi:hypothetical protein